MEEVSCIIQKVRLLCHIIARCLDWFIIFIRHHIFKVKYQWFTPIFINDNVESLKTVIHK